MADVLWKTNQFNEAHKFALKAKDIINNPQKWGDYDFYSTTCYVEAAIDTIIDKCQRREKWKWAK